MKATPKGWPRISTALYYDDAGAAIDWLCRAFGFEIRIKVEGDPGRIAHSELVLGDGVIMVGEARGEGDKFVYRRSPRQIGGGNTQSLMMYVDDVESHCSRARTAGAKILEEPKTSDYGDEYWVDRGYWCEDVGGHRWYIAERLRDAKPKP